MFLTDTSFHTLIEKMVNDKKISYLDAVLLYCSENEIDPEDIPKLLTSNLKDKIKIDAMNEGLMKKTSMLPI